eukprot:5159935-Karenia_brevis.AAC.1
MARRKPFGYKLVNNACLQPASYLRSRDQWVKHCLSTSLRHREAACKIARGGLKLRNVGICMITF